MHAQKELRVAEATESAMALPYFPFPNAILAFSAKPVILPEAKLPAQGKS